MSIQSAACDRDNSDSESDLCVKCNDNSTEADDPEEDFISNDAVT
jgi:hypothetical protein